MASSMASSRRARGAANQQAKDRRQKLMIAGLGGLLLVLLVVQLPKLLSRGGSSSSSSTPATVVATTPTAVPDTSAAQITKAYRAALKQAPRDVFTVRQLSSDNTLGAVATPAGLHDPFAKPHSAQAAVAPATQKPVSASPLPGTIIVGTPGANKVTVQGWIVILASIPTAQGADAANSFAAQARKAGFGTVSVLNSSSRKPLRGGYWVVYTGPYNTLAQVSNFADTIHGSGFRTAYIRQLVMYKAKPAPPHTKAKKKTKK
jgi:septal ring-binding cell division protein DamX